MNAYRSDPNTSQRDKREKDDLCTHVRTRMFDIRPAYQTIHKLRTKKRWKKKENIRESEKENKKKGNKMEKEKERKIQDRTNRDGILEGMESESEKKRRRGRETFISGRFARDREDRRDLRWRTRGMRKRGRMGLETRERRMAAKVAGRAAVRRRERNERENVCV